jgi:hypothetical protein
LQRKCLTNLTAHVAQPWYARSATEGTEPSVTLASVILVIGNLRCLQSRETLRPYGQSNCSFHARVELIPTPQRRIRGLSASEQ